MGFLRNLCRVALLGLVTLITADASCTAICKFGGHNTSCSERIAWVQSHVDNWNRVLVAGPAEDKKLTCKQSREKVLHDCPVCKQCSMEEACTLHQGDLVSVLYFDKQRHLGHITGVLHNGKYEVTLKDMPVVIPSTNAVQKAFAAHPMPTAVPGLVAAKYSEMSEISGTNDFQPHFFVGAVIGGVGIVGLSAMVVRKFGQKRDNSGHLVELEE